MHIKPCICRQRFQQDVFRVPAERDCQVVPGKHGPLRFQVILECHHRMLTGRLNASIRRAHGRGTLWSLKTTRWWWWLFACGKYLCQQEIYLAGGWGRRKHWSARMSRSTSSEGSRLRGPRWTCSTPSTVTFDPLGSCWLKLTNDCRSVSVRPTTSLQRSPLGCFTQQAFDKNGEMWVSGWVVSFLTAHQYI